MVTFHLQETAQTQHGDQRQKPIKHFLSSLNMSDEHKRQLLLLRSTIITNKTRLLIFPQINKFPADLFSN